jgi:hypothetical protein
MVLIKQIIRSSLLKLQRKDKSYHYTPKLTFHAGRAMAQAVSLLPLTAAARVRTRVSPPGIYGQSCAGTCLSPSSYVLFPCQYHPPSLSILIHLMGYQQ